MNLFFIIAILCFLSMFIVLIYIKIKDRKLIKSVTRLDRGTRSERLMILKILKSGIKPTAIFHDIYLNNSLENYNQIDLVVATKVGIIVFEIKEYNGWIFGSENQMNWTQILAYGHRRYKFYNPILQNKKHVENLKKFNLFENIPIFSMIVFFGNCKFKNNFELPNHTFFTKSNNSIKTFNDILQKHQPIKYSDQWEVSNFFKETVKNGEDLVITTKHVDNIQKLKKRNLTKNT